VPKPICIEEISALDDLKKYPEPDVAKLVGCRHSTVSLWRKKGETPKPTKIGGSYFYLGSDLKAWLIDGVLNNPDTPASNADGWSPNDIIL